MLIHTTYFFERPALHTELKTNRRPNFLTPTPSPPYTQIDVDYNVTRKEFKFANKHNLPFFFCSAADGTNVVKVFENAVAEAYKFKQSGGDMMAEMLSLLGESKLADADEDEVEEGKSERK